MKPVHLLAGLQSASNYFPIAMYRHDGAAALDVRIMHDVFVYLYAPMILTVCVYVSSPDDTIPDGITIYSVLENATGNIIDAA